LELFFRRQIFFEKSPKFGKIAAGDLKRANIFVDLDYQISYSSDFFLMSVFELTNRGGVLASRKKTRFLGSPWRRKRGRCTTICGMEKTVRFEILISLRNGHIRDNR
jgi:hypothetical protein